MGRELSEEEIAAIAEPEPAITAHFEEATVSTHALDAASKVVPERVWKEPGLYSWLTRRANEAFKKMPASARSVEMGRLRYVFEYANDRPVLKTVILIPG